MTFFTAILKNTYTFTKTTSPSYQFQLKFEYESHFITSTFVWLKKNLLKNSLNQNLYPIEKEVSFKNVNANIKIKFVVNISI